MRGGGPRGMRHRTPHSKLSRWRSERYNDPYMEYNDPHTGRRDERFRHSKVRTVRSLSPRDEQRKLSVHGREFVREHHLGHSFNSRDDARRPPVKVRRAAAAPDEARTLQFDRVRSRKYSPPCEGAGDEDTYHKSFASESANNTANDAGNNILGRSGDSLLDQSKSKDFAHGSGKGTVLDGYGMLMQKSIVLEDGTVRTFFTLPPITADPLSEPKPKPKPKPYAIDDVNTSKTGVSYSIGNVNFGFQNSSAVHHAQDPRYLEFETPHHLPSSRSVLREPYGNEVKGKYYSRSAAYLMGPPQSKCSALDTTSSRLPRDTPFGAYRDSLHTLSEDFLSSDKYPDTSTREECRQKEIYGRESNSTIYAENLPAKSLETFSSRRMPCSPLRGEALTGAYTEIVRRERPEHTFGSDEPYNKGRDSPYRHCDYANSSQGRPSHQYGSSKSSYFGDTMSDQMEDTGNFRKQLKEVASKDDHMQMDAVDSYGNMHRIYSPRAVSTDAHGGPFPSRRDHPSAGLRMEASTSPPIRHCREEFPYRRGPPIVDHREASRSPLPEAAISSRRSNLSMRSRSHLPIQGMDTCAPLDRMLKRKHIGEERGDCQGGSSNGQNNYRKLPKMNLNDAERRERQRDLIIDGKYLGAEPPRHCTHLGRSFHSESPRGVSDLRPLSEDKSLHRQEWLLELQGSSARIRNPSKWTRPSSCYDDVSLHKMEKKLDYYYPNKFRKHSGMDDEQGRTWNRHCVKDDDLQDNGEPVHQPDLPEDSEGFKQRVHRAYLRFSKLLNENPGLRKRYDDQGKSGSLVCIVCSRLSKDFVDTHSLVMHTFNSKKAGLRAEHLGLHKALCVLMGWSHAAVPDNAKVYQSLPSPEATAMKEDLILWPPLVIVHNACNGKKNGGCKEGGVNLEMDEILRELGFRSGKLKAVYGGDAHHGTTVVKFLPTFSGLQEAERLHKYYEDNNHGRKDWLRLQSLCENRQNVNKDPDQIQIDENTKEKKGVLYGYIGIAGDLEKVDFDTRKRALVKSRKDIEAIADGSVGGA